MRRISFVEALNESLHQEMERDESVFVYGIGVPDHMDIFGSTEGLLDRFGPNRVLDTPLAEDAMTGFGFGAAINGLKPVHIHIRVDFLLLAMNQLVNMISSYSYSTEGRHGVPLVIRAVIGRGWGQGYQHSKSLHSYFAHIPGLKVVLPTTPRDAKGLLTAAIRDPNPVVFLEHRWLYWAEDEVEEESFEIPLGTSNVLRKGTDATVVAISWMNIEALRAAEILAREGVSIEVIDPRTISPLDDGPIIESVTRTGHLIAAEHDWVQCGFTAEIAARVSEKAFDALKSPVTRIGFEFTPTPTVRHLEDRFYPNAVDIIRAVERKLDLDPIDISGEDFYSHESRFKGPF